jgi:hypothetical protein
MEALIYSAVGTCHVTDSLFDKRTSAEQLDMVAAYAGL